MKAQTAKIDRALGYPYERPETSYLFSGGIAKNLPGDIDLTDRQPVLACGSNGAPEQLLRKYGARSDIAIPVTAATMSDIACTYSAHFSSYGSIAAALCTVPGIESRVHITWLTEAELQRMHETEAIGMNYHFAHLEGVTIQCEATGPIKNLHAYISLRGSLLLDGKPVLLKGIPAKKTHLLKLDQRAMQEEIRRRLAPDTALEDFILENISNRLTRLKRTAMISQKTEPFIHSGITVLFPNAPYLD
ncbi:hypothetical protein NBZ79_13450 [Sneathiella marina]|uniref:Uncharacterized protein n=1 Tax=Sneathiella marina TaxID=2950108 RepID=A0ABY4W2R7_9PROT|nr:hypothetical protein [Sneathiella marina]USG60182.1 hypothetical protein NBZ79_13450 [Sneathiella marina]